MQNPGKTCLPYSVGRQIESTRRARTQFATHNSYSAAARRKIGTRDINISFTRANSPKSNLNSNEIGRATREGPKREGTIGEPSAGLTAIIHFVCSLRAHALEPPHILRRACCTASRRRSEREFGRKQTENGF